MNRLIMAILTLTAVLLLVQCDTEESRKEKAEDYIKQDLFETLPDYKSYELVSIEMDTIKETWISISGIIDLAKEYRQALMDKDNADIQYNELLAQKKRLEGSALSTYMTGDIFEWARYGRESEQLDIEIANANSQCKQAADKAETIYDKLADKIKENESEDFVGWNVTHKFRANNDDGVSQLYCYHYYISPDMKQTLIKWDDKDFEIPQLFHLMENILVLIKNGEVPLSLEDTDI